MSPIRPDRYWLQVSRAAYPLVEPLLRQAVRVSLELRGPTGIDTYLLDPRLDVTALADDALAVGHTVLSAQLNHLPTHAYRGLVGQSPGFQQYPDLPGLYTQVRGGQPLDALAFTRRLEEIVAAGRQIMPEPCLVVTPSTFRAQWWPHETYLRRSVKGDWFICLTFEALYVPSGVQRPRAPIGLDLGLNPLTVAFSTEADVRTFTPTSLGHLRVLSSGPPLSAPAAQLLRDLTYASGRQDAERVIAYLIHCASRVHAEVIRLQDMSPGFVFPARDRAVSDHHFSSLSQYLYAAHIPFQRVSSGYTSRLCPMCRERFGRRVEGRRNGHRFQCLECGATGNAHVIAAHNILLRGEAAWARSG